MAAKKKNQYYRIQELLKLGDTDKDIRYFLVFGERSAGKSYSTSEEIVKDYVEKGKQTGLIRRYDVDWNSNVAGTYFDGIVGNGVVEKLTNGQYTDIYYWGHKWYLCSWKETSDGLVRVKAEEPFAFAFALNKWENSKAGQFPKVHQTVLEEYISSSGYLGSENNEFNAYLNMVSTLARDKEDFRNILLGNTIAKYGNPYHICMGIEKGVLNMRPGDTIVFKDDSKKLKIAVQYTDPPAGGKKSDILFDFPTDNTVSRQITSGEWQIDTHFPILPMGTRIKPKDIKYKYFLKYRYYVLQADIVKTSDGGFITFFHNKTTPMKELKKDLIFDLEYHLENNYRRDPLKPLAVFDDVLGKRIALQFRDDLVYVQDPSVGEILWSYLQSL